MSLPSPMGDVAVFVDFENVYISVRNRHDLDPNFELVMDRCAEYGRVTTARAYADWYRYPRVTSALYANGIEPMYVPTHYYGRDDSRSRAIKNSVDIHLCIDLMRSLYEQPHVETYVLVTGDGDFVPLVNSIRQHGKRIVVVGVAGASSAQLAQAADEFILYRSLLEEENGPKATARDPYQALVEAVQLARRRGIASTLGSLKLLLSEILGRFDEGDYKDSRGKPFSKFKEFVREAERRGLVQMFTSGTTNEVFLPGEDPYQVSAFVSGPSPEAEDQEEDEEAEPGSRDLQVGPREWKLFQDTMGQFREPVMFVHIYNALRGLRNQELLDLSNAELREFIKLAIDLGILVRSTKGAHAYYELNESQPLPGDTQAVETSAPAG